MEDGMNEIDITLLADTISQPDPERLATMAADLWVRDMLIIHALTHADTATLIRVGLGDRRPGSKTGREVGRLLAEAFHHGIDTERTRRIRDRYANAPASPGLTATIAYLDWVLGEQATAMQRATDAMRRAPDMSLPALVASLVRDNITIEEHA